MEELLILKEALDFANQKGCFTLEQSAQIVNTLAILEGKLNEKDK